MQQELSSVGGAQRAPVRGTQRLVHILFRCWHHPSLTALEVLWRWTFGIPVLIIVGTRALHILRDASLAHTGLAHLTILDPMQAAQILADVAIRVLPPLANTAEQFALVLIVLWGIASGLGRMLVLKKAQAVFPELAPMYSKPFTLVLLQMVRITALGASFIVWFLGLQWATSITITRNLQAGQDANLVLFAALVIVLSLGLFSLWATVSWVFSAAPMLASIRGTGFFGSLRGAFQLGSLAGKLVEVNLVMGIIKLALIVLAMVFSATPLPFESVTSDAFLHWWWAGVTLLYLVASDFFHVARVIAYIELWKIWRLDKTAPEPVSYPCDERPA